MKISLSEIVANTLQNRMEELVNNMSRNNAVLFHMAYEKLDKSISIPDFMKGRAKGLYVLHNGTVYRLKKFNPQ